MKRLFLLLILVSVFLLGGCGLGWLWQGDGISTGGVFTRVYAEEVIPTATVATPTVTPTETSATLDLGTLIAKLPCLNQAVLYSWDSNSVKYAMSFTVISLFNNFLNLDAMYVPATEVGALASIKLFNLGKWVKFPLLEYIEFQPFVYYGLKNIGTGSKLGEGDYGAGAKIISIKF